MFPIGILSNLDFDIQMSGFNNHAILIVQKKICLFAIDGSLHDFLLIANTIFEQHAFLNSCQFVRNVWHLRKHVRSWHKCILVRKTDGFKWRLFSWIILKHVEKRRNHFCEIGKCVTRRMPNLTQIEIYAKMHHIQIWKIQNECQKTECDNVTLCDWTSIAVNSL